MSLAEAQRLCPDVSRETWARLERLVALLEKWQRTINLVAPSSLPDVWVRHVADSLQLLKLAPGAKHWVDLGSGGGFPGLVVAAAFVEVEGASVELIESDQRKCGFLREAAREMRAPVKVHNARIEAALEDWAAPVDVVSARALAPLPKLIDLAFPLLKRGAIGLFPKGQDVEAELTLTAKSWHIESRLVPSLTDPRSRVVVVSKAARHYQT